MATCLTTQTEPANFGSVAAIELAALPIPSITSVQCKLGTSDPENVKDEAAPPTTAVNSLQRWNYPRANMWRVFACFWSFLVVGMNDGSYGALIPYLEKYYDLNYTVVSLVFLSPFAGYTMAAFLNNMMHVKFGQRGVAVVGPACHLISYIFMAVHPPYPVLVVIFIFVGFGNGLIDAACLYALGATVAPLMATAMFTKGSLPWYSFYYLMISTSAIELVTSSVTFWKQTGDVYQLENPVDPDSNSGRTKEALKNKVTWIFAVFIFGYVGAEVSLGGWIVTFMTKVRSASSFSSGVTATGFWAGMTVGRIGLSFLTARLGEFRSVLLYLGFCLGLELIFWLVPSLVASAVAVAFLGMFLGPLFPTAIVVVTKLLPRHLHVSSIGFGAALGGSGGAIFPFAVGAIAQAKGVKTLQPIILAILVVISGLWILLPKAGKRDEGERQELTADI